jgi:hypothetical protein
MKFIQFPVYFNIIIELPFLNYDIFFSILYLFSKKYILETLSLTQKHLVLAHKKIETSITSRLKL